MVFFITNNEIGCLFSIPDTTGNDGNHNKNRKCLCKQTANKELFLQLKHGKKKQWIS